MGHDIVASSILVNVLIYSVFYTFVVYSKTRMTLRSSYGQQSFNRKNTNIKSIAGR